MISSPWFWNVLFRWHWPAEFALSDVARGLQNLSRRWPELPPSADSPIFIFSAGWRTGSTLLQRLINSDENVLVWGEPYEYSFMFYYLCKSLAIFQESEVQVDVLPEGFSLEPFATASPFTRSWTAKVSPPVSALKNAHIAFFDALFGRPAASLGRPRWGLKLTRGVAPLAFYLRWLYPNSKIIFLFRNPFDSYRSYVNVARASWYVRYPSHKIKNATSFMVHWTYCMSTFLESYRDLDALLLPYESMVRRHSLPEVARYLNAEIDQSVLDLVVDVGKSPFPKCLSRKDKLIIRSMSKHVTDRLAQVTGLDYTKPGD
jgi:hypothetical protein